MKLVLAVVALVVVATLAPAAAATRMPEAAEVSLPGNTTNVMTWLLEFAGAYQNGNATGLAKMFSAQVSGELPLGSAAVNGNSAVASGLLGLTAPFAKYSVDAYAVVANFDAPGVNSNYATFTLVIQGVSKNGCLVTWNSQVIVAFDAPQIASSYLALWDVNDITAHLAAKCPVQ